MCLAVMDGWRSRGGSGLEPANALFARSEPASQNTLEINTIAADMSMCVVLTVNRSISRSEI